MASDRTLVPGMDSDVFDNLYSRGSNNQFNTGGTFIPGMQENAPGVKPTVNKPGANGQGGDNNEPTLGFLYSISRRGVGEYWPLHLGSNTIGRDSSNRIQLKERTVSTKHAELFVRKMKSTGEVIASIRDCGSKLGMFLNEEELDFEIHAVKNGDILTVGANYRLLVILINPNALGLSIAPDFQAIDEDETPSRKPRDPFDQTYNPERTTRPKRDDGTIDLNGGQNPFSVGGTSTLE